MTSVETPVTPTEMIVVVDPREALWVQFLQDLTWWQRKTLYRRELTLHDSFIDGDKSLMDIFVEVAEKADEPPLAFSIKA